MLSFSQRLFGDDRNAAKLAFRSGFVPRLAAQVVPPDDPSWADFFLIFDSLTDVCTLLPVSAVRSILAAHPSNIATLISILCEHLHALLADPDFPAPLNSPLSPLRSSRGAAFLRRSANSVAPTNAPDLAREALNCVRVLSRVLPCVFERAGLGPPASSAVIRDELAEGGTVNEPAFEPERFESDVLWTPRRRPKVVDEPMFDDRFTIDDDRQDQVSAEEPKTDDDHMTLPSLGEDLLSVVIDLLFVVRFTLPMEAVADGQRDQRIAYVIWEAGIGSTTSMGSTAELDANRIEILRLLLVLLSRSMFVPPTGERGEADDAATNCRPSSSVSPIPSTSAAAPDTFLRLIRAWPTRRTALSLLCSLLNTAILSAPTLPVPSTARSLSNAAASVPLVGSVFSGFPTAMTSPVASMLGRESEHKKTLGQMCLSILDVLLIDTLPGDENVFRHYVSKLHRSADFAFLATGLIDMLGSAAAAAGASETGEPAAGVVEGLVLFWRLIACNEVRCLLSHQPQMASPLQKFLSAVLSGQTVAPRLLCSLLLICLDQHDASAAIGIIRLCTFVLQTLSAERSFAARIGVVTENAGVRGASRGRWAVQGTVSDFLVISIYTLVFTTKGALSSLYPAFTCILINCSPYFKRLSVVAATRLTQLFLAFSAPVFLLAEEDNPRLCYNMVEVFNNCIHFQLSDNPNLTYALIRCHARFEELASFTLQSAVADIRKARAERESRPALKTNTSTASLTPATAPSSPTAFDIIDDPFPGLSEKARGKMRERSIDRDDGFPGPYTSRTGFTPTAAWVASWREALPLDTVLVLLTELRPRVESLCATGNASTNQAALDYLRAATLLGLLPPTPALKPRRFLATSHADRWLLSMVWSTVYLRQSALFAATRVALFSVLPGQAVRGVSDEVADAATRFVGALQRRTSMQAGSRTEMAVV